ncbi:MAG TPA: carboxypeptidase-like regulatory domain-containing protein, partial [Bryobacteraceae bacterium]|nr:carboxypeptidase-like regulatory domain-containing protein [Bryobacteraceae bacterium]
MRLTLAGLVLSLLASLAPVCRAQTSATATIVGQVTDASGSAIPGASIELTDLSSKQTRRQPANAMGQYTISGVVPGNYQVSASARGFQQSEVSSLTVQVAKSYIVNFTLQVGNVSESIEVKADTAELQTLDATVGSEIAGESLLRMPAINRSAMTFFALQPLVIPTRGTISLQAGQHLSGQVAGARADQSTFTVDGVDVTDITSGTNFYSAAATDFNGPTPMIPVPAESVEEFRLSTTNPNATYHQSAGGQLNLITKRGANALHGSGYWYLQNNVLNANRWDYNRAGIARPALHDDRFGASAGGPLIHDKTFFYVNYEGRRLPQSSPVTRLVPTASLKQGILKFVDGTGAVRSYDVQSFDPRGIGIDPLVESMWNRLPAGNDPGLGDGLNTTGFLAPVNSSLTSNFAVVRVDHNFNENWRLSGSYRYASQTANGVSQVDIAGFAQGDTPGVGAPAARTNVQPRMLSVELSTIVSPRVVNDLTLGDSRNFWADQRTPPRPQVPGTAGALDIAQNFLDQGLDVTAGTARSRVWDNHNYQVRDNLSWVKGKHNLQFGGGLEYIPAFHQRDDKIVGTQFTSLVYNLNARTSVGIPQTSRPPTCGSSASANCLPSSAVAEWNDLFAGALGIVDSAGVIATRDASLNPLPPDTPIRTRVHWEDVDLYFNDVWRLNNALTITAGLNYSIQTPPSGDMSSQAIPVDQGTGQPLTANLVFSNRRAAALQGQIWNPTVAWLPVGKGAPQGVYSTAWDDIGPRISASWNPSFTGGWLGRVFGNQKTVFRGGYGLVFDRINGSTNTFFPPLNVAFAQTLSCFGPRVNGSCQAGSDPTTAFRIGIDGSTVPLSAQLPASALVPPLGNSETTSFALDPTLRPGYAHMVNFTLQREVGGGFLIEAGYVGHFGRDLMQSVDLNAVPYFMKDATSGQSFAQAYDAVAQYLRGGGAAGSVPLQPWFENQLRGAKICTTSCTAGLAASQNGAFTQGLLNTLFNVINTQRPAGPITNFQVSSLWMRTNGGISNYNAGFVSVQRRFSSGLSLQANYTLSRSLDEHGYNQEAESLVSNGYNLRLDYAPSAFDRTHVFSSNFFYDLPFGRGKLALRPGLNKAVGGWYLGGIFSANSGVPLTVQESTSAWGGAPQVGSVPAGAIPIAAIDPRYGVNAHVAGSNGIGTSGNPARGGSGLNLFADPAAVFSDFRPILLSADGRNGRDVLRGLS